MNTFASILNIAAALNGNPHSLWNQIGGISNSDIGKVKFDMKSEVYYEVISIKHNKDADGNIISSVFEFKTYSDYKWDEEKKKYVGVNQTGTYYQIEEKGKPRGSAVEMM